MSYYDKERIHALFKWYMQQVGKSLISVLIVGKDGLMIDILTRDKDKSDEKRFIGAFSALVDVILKKITIDFDLGTFGAGSFDTDKYRFTFCESGTEFVVITILDPLTFVDEVFPYTYIVAEKAAHIIDGDLPVSPVIPKLKRESDIEKVKYKMDNYRKKWSHSPDFVYKLSLIGDGGVGKTSIVNRYISGVFIGDYRATIGAFISKKEVKFKELDTSVRFLIWDLAGQEQFKRLWPDYLSDSNVGIIVFDITDPKSFENINYYYETLIKVASPNLLVVLAGNKADLENERRISTMEAQELAEKLGLYYVETSAKTSENINEIFEWISLQLIDRNIKWDELELMGEVDSNSKFLISESQLRFLEQHFIRQLDFVIDKSEIQKYLKYLDVLKTIEKSKL